MQRSVLFKAVIAAGAEGFFERTIKERCLLEKYQVKFPPGSESTLHIKPVKVDKFDNEILLFNRDDNGIADDYISGDDAIFDLDFDITFDVGEKIRVYYNNTDNVNEHEFYAIFRILQVVEVV